MALDFIARGRGVVQFRVVGRWAVFLDLPLWCRSRDASGPPRPVEAGTEFLPLGTISGRWCRPPVVLGQCRSLQYRTIISRTAANLGCQWVAPVSAVFHC